MFTTNQRGTAGLGTIIGIAALIALYFAGAGLLWKTYREGGNATGTDCQLVCHQPVMKTSTNG